jgi:hypothetical protein
MSPRAEQSRIASATIATGFTVGCSADRLPSWPAAGEGVGSGVAPNIGAVAPEPVELDVIAVPVAAVLEDKNKLVLAAVERTHPGIILDPDAEVFQFAIGGTTGGQQLFHMAPVHADEMDGAVTAKRRQVAKRRAEKGREFGAVHLARSHREGAMVGRSKGNYTLD